MERKLASIQKIKKLHKLDQFDNLLLAEVLGWRCLVKKDEFQEGDSCIYFEVDSLLPERPEFSFMERYKYRVKTIKMKGVFSQGLCLPLKGLLDGEYNEGDDVTEALNVKKYEIPESLSMAGDIKGAFPGFLFKTDQPRIQAYPEVLNRNYEEPVYVSEKLDGTSATFFLYNDQFGVCSRNYELKETEGNIYWRVARKYKLEEILREYNKQYGKNLAIQGEIIGPKVQNNKYKLSELQLHIFDIFDVDTSTYFDFDKLVNFKTEFNLLYKLPTPLETVPIFYRTSMKGNMGENWTVDGLILMSIRESCINAEIPREGIVIRSVYNHKFDPEIGRLSFKVINPEFLVKYGG
jgi:RNA ligase (TIGR02306 family)